MTTRMTSPYADNTIGSAFNIASVRAPCRSSQCWQNCAAKTKLSLCDESHAVANQAVPHTMYNPWVYTLEEQKSGMKGPSTYAWNALVDSCPSLNTPWTYGYGTNYSGYGACQNYVTRTNF